MSDLQNGAYHEGVAARFFSAAYSDCPYINRCENQRLWMKGWSNQAEAEAEGDSLY